MASRTITVSPSRHVIRDPVLPLPLVVAAGLAVGWLGVQHQRVSGERVAADLALSWALVGASLALLVVDGVASPRKSRSRTTSSPSTSARGACAASSSPGPPVSNNQFVMTYPADANGDVRELINGALKEQVTNGGAGKSIVVNVSGPATEIVHPDGTADLTIEGSVLVSYNARDPNARQHDRHREPFDVCAALS
jgi:hypothetical protein